MRGLDPYYDSSPTMTEEEFFNLPDAGLVLRETTLEEDPDKAKKKEFPWLWVILGLLVLLFVIGGAKKAKR